MGPLLVLISLGIMLNLNLTDAQDNQNEVNAQKDKKSNKSNITTLTEIKEEKDTKVKVQKEVPLKNDEKENGLNISINRLVFIQYSA